MMVSVPRDTYQLFSPSSVGTNRSRIEYTPTLPILSKDSIWSKQDADDDSSFPFSPILEMSLKSVFDEEEEDAHLSKSGTPRGAKISRTVPLSEKCYLCMNNIIENAKDIVIMRCSERCGTRLHFSCAVNSMWPHPNTGIICPVCTKDEHVHWSYGPSPPMYRKDKMRSPPPYPQNRSKEQVNGEYRFLCKARSLLIQYVGWADLRAMVDDDFREVMRGIRQCVNKKAGMISGSGKVERKSKQGGSGKVDEQRYQRAAMFFIQKVRLSSFLESGTSIACIYQYITDRFEGLLLMGLCLEDLKMIEKNKDMEDFVRLYDVSSPKLRSYLGEDEMCLKNLIRTKLSAHSMETLGINAHELCVMKLTQEEMQQFDYLTMEDWIFHLKMTATCLQVLRIKAKDIDRPTGKLNKMGWDMIAFDQYMNLSVHQKNTLKLHVNVPRVGVTTRYESFAEKVAKTSSRSKPGIRDSSSPKNRGSWRSTGRSSERQKYPSRGHT